MIVHWNFEGLRFDPENPTEKRFLDGLQDLFRTVRVEMKDNPLSSEWNNHLKARFLERLDFDRGGNNGTDSTDAG